MLTASVKVSSLYNFINLDGFRFDWQLEKGNQPVASLRQAYRVEPMSNFFFPMSIPYVAGADRLRVSVFDSDGYSIQEEEFPLPAPTAPSTINDLLKKVDVGETKALSVKAGAMSVHAETFMATWDAAPWIHLKDRLGRDLATLNGFAMQAEKSAWTSMEVGGITYQPLTIQDDSIVIPFSASGNTTDKKTSWSIPGTIRVNFSESSLRVTYTLQPKTAVSIPEAGLRLLLGAPFTHLSWNREALWSVPPKDAAEGALEQQILLPAMRATGSKRRVYWASAEGEGAAVLMVPLETTTNLRPGDSDHEIVLSDFLASGNFLGKSDKETAEKKLAAGEKLEGGFTLYFLTKEQQARFQNLTDAEKDLTWARRVKAEAAVQ